MFFFLLLSLSAVPKQPSVSPCWNYICFTHFIFILLVLLLSDAVDNLNVMRCTSFQTEMNAYLWHGRVRRHKTQITMTVGEPDS